MKTGALARFVEDYGKGLALVSFAFALAGLAFAFRLPVSLFPQTDFPRVVILVDNGVTPVDIQMLTVTRRLEEAARRVPGVTDIRSVTARGETEISVFFRWDVDIVDALQLGARRDRADHADPAARVAVLHQSADLLRVSDGRL